MTVRELITRLERAADVHGDGTRVVVQTGDEPDDGIGFGFGTFALCDPRDGRQVVLSLDVTAEADAGAGVPIIDVELGS